jgi:GNAT superfamily N-acetyltransferase
MHLTPPSPLKPEHDLKSFDCGKKPLDDWLRQRALKAEGITARTYVVCEGIRVVGYYTLVTGAVRREEAPKRLSRNSPVQIPVLLLARLAVHSGAARAGIGSGLLKDAMRRFVQVSTIVGVRALLVHALDDDAAAFYLKFGFVEFPAGSHTLFLPLETITSAV